MDIVVARFNENLDWTMNLENVIIYNKGEKLPEHFNSKQLPNIGREQHTYYTHIYENYYNLNDYTVFLQGNPFEHTKNLIFKIPPIDFEFLSDDILDCNLRDCKYHSGLDLMGTYSYLFGKLPKKKFMPFKFGAGSQFIVSKQRIQSRPRDFYLKVLGLLDNNNPDGPYIFERFTRLIFSKSLS